MPDTAETAKTPYGRFRHFFIGLIVGALSIRGGSGAALDDQPHLRSMCDSSVAGASAASGHCSEPIE